MEVTTKVTKSSSILYQWYSLVASPEVWVHWLVLWAAINGRWNGRASYVKQGQLFLGEITIGSKFLQLLSSWFWIHDILEKANGSLMEMLVWWRCGGNKKRSSAVAIVDIASATNLYMHTRDYQDDQARHYYNEGPLTKKTNILKQPYHVLEIYPFFLHKKVVNTPTKGKSTPQDPGNFHLPVSQRHLPCRRDFPGWSLWVNRNNIRLYVYVVYVSRMYSISMT